MFLRWKEKASGRSYGKRVTRFFYTLILEFCAKNELSNRISGPFRKIRPMALQHTTIFCSAEKPEPNGYVSHILSPCEV